MLLQKNPVSWATRGDLKPFWDHQEVFALAEVVGQSSDLNGYWATIGQLRVPHWVKLIMAFRDINQSSTSVTLTEIYPNINMQLPSFATMKLTLRTLLGEIVSSQAVMSVSENLKTEICSRLWRTNRSYWYFKDGRGPLQFWPPSLSVCHVSMQPTEDPLAAPSSPRVALFHVFPTFQTTCLDDLFNCYSSTERVFT